MNGDILSALHESRRKQIAACIASVFCLAAPTVTLAVTVTSCLDDGGGGTLRSIVTGAAEGATIDFAGLDCTATSNKITLVGSYIQVAQNSLTIDGSGAVHPLSIDASGLYRGYADSRVITHVGTGTLGVYNLTLENGYILHVGPTSYGGCLWSAGNVTLSSATVTQCEITHNGGVTPLGGAIYVKGNLTLRHSTVSHGSATGSVSAAGGGVYVKGNLNVKYSVIASNQVTSDPSKDGTGGAAFVRGGIATKYSTISGNSATSRAGGVYVNGNATVLATTISGNSAASFGGIDAYSPTPAGNTFELGNSTVSGNTATLTTGGMWVNSGTTYLYNSTIAFNSAPVYAGVILNSYGAMAVMLESTLISNNSVGLSDNDLFTTGTGMTINGGNVVTPANNLIRATNATLPHDTKVSCPLLGPLNNNGGLTKTHALGSTSPAIDRGNTVGTGGGAGMYDQRGSSTANGVRNYLRESAPIGSIDPPVADIGAYEVQQDDEIFDAFFDGCNPLI
jgi:hypothetical protein